MYVDEVCAVAALSFLNQKFGMHEFSWLRRCLLEGEGIESSVRRKDVPGEVLRTVTETPEWRKVGIHQLKLIGELGAKLVFPGHPEYPMNLLNIACPPVALTVIGEAPWKGGRGLSVVGSREPSIQSEHWIQSELARFLEGSESFVLSGAARGVDQRAHAVALMKKQPTVAVFPSGLAQIYPTSFSQWMKPILDGGGSFVSEYAPEVKMRKGHFQRRNRLIAGITDRLLLVEGRRRSGSLMTAHMALEHHASVAVVPSHPSHNNALGGLDLIFAGATPVRDHLDLKDWFTS